MASNVTLSLNKYSSNIFTPDRNTAVFGTSFTDSSVTTTSTYTAADSSTTNTTGTVNLYSTGSFSSSADISTFSTGSTNFNISSTAFQSRNTTGYIYEQYTANILVSGTIHSGRYCGDNVVSYDGTNITITPSFNMSSEYNLINSSGNSIATSNSTGKFVVAKSTIGNSNIYLSFFPSITSSWNSTCNSSTYTSVTSPSPYLTQYTNDVSVSSVQLCSDNIYINPMSRTTPVISIVTSGDDLTISCSNDNTGGQYSLYIDNTLINTKSTPSWSLSRASYYGNHSIKITAEPYAKRASWTGKSVSDGSNTYKFYNSTYYIYDAAEATTSTTISIPAPASISVLQNGIERPTNQYIDSLYVSWSAVTGISTYYCRIYNVDSNNQESLVDSVTINSTNHTFNNLTYSATNHYKVLVSGKYNSTYGADASTTKSMSKIPTPTNIVFTRVGVNNGNLAWTSSYSDTSLTYYEIYDGSTLLGTTNNTSYTLTSITQGSHSFGVKMMYINTLNNNSEDFSSALGTVSTTLSKLSTPTLTYTENSGNVIFKDSEDDDCYLLTDGTFVKVSDYTSGSIKQGITGLTFSYVINPGYDLTGVSYAFYNKLGNDNYEYDTAVANQTRTVSVGDTTYNSAGIHKVKVKAVFTDSDYNSDDSNEVQYPINTLAAPILLWGNTNHPSSQIAPTGYKTVEYIESDGSQYIDTGYAPEQLANIDIEFMYLGDTNSGLHCLYGVNGTAGTSNFTMFVNQADNLAEPMYSTFNPGSSSTTEINPNGYMHIKTNAGQVYLNEQLQNSISTNLKNRTTPDANLYLLALSTPNQSASNHIKARIYDCNIYNDTTLVRQFIPVVRISDSIAGLYDLVNDVFYPSASNSNFTAGDEITLWDENKIYESRIEWLPVTTTVTSDNYADYYLVELIGNDTVVGNAITILQPANNLVDRIGTWIPDPDPINGAVKGLIAQLPSTTTNYTVNIRALSFNNWYIGGSLAGVDYYTINRLAAPEDAEWDAETNTLSWSAVTDANTYYIYDSGTLIKTVTGATSYTFTNLSDGLHRFRITAMKRTFAVN